MKAFRSKIQIQIKVETFWKVLPVPCLGAELLWKQHPAPDFASDMFLKLGLTPDAVKRKNFYWNIPSGTS